MRLVDLEREFKKSDQHDIIPFKMAFNKYFPNECKKNIHTLYNIEINKTNNTKLIATTHDIDIIIDIKRTLINARNYDLQKIINKRYLIIPENNNVLNILNELNFIKSALIITTDKVYFNNNKKSFYKESDRLGGLDPYSNSKTCAELIVDTYNQSFLKKKYINIATARAGNVIGGGDFSTDRIIPDYFRALASNNKKLLLRAPNFIRPWQFILDPLYGYLLLLMKLYKKQRFEDHNSGKSLHTSKYSPWSLEFYCAFNDKYKALEFEKYLKSHSGNAFTKKHF
jgi:CDP-glucose 4,6-dehydratase